MNKNDNIPKHKMCNLYFILKSFFIKNYNIMRSFVRNEFIQIGFNIT